MILLNFFCGERGRETERDRERAEVDPGVIKTFWEYGFATFHRGSARVYSWLLTYSRIRNGHDSSAEPLDSGPI